MQKNTSGQKLVVFAFDVTTNLAKTADGANITAYVSKDYGAVTQLTDTSATEMDSTNAKGYYLFDLSQAETNADTLTFTAKSSTASIAVIGVPAVAFTTPPNFGLIRQFTAAGGTASTITFDAGAPTTPTDLFKGCEVEILLGTGAGQGGRVITSYNSSRVAGVKPDWATPPDTTSVCIVKGAGVDVESWGGAAVNALLSGRIDANTQATASALSFNLTGNIAGNLSGSVASVTGAVGSVTAGVTVTTNNDKTGYTLTVTPPTSAQIATAVWQDATAGDFTTASSIGKCLYIANVAPGAAGGHLIAGSNAATTFATLTSTGAFTVNGVSDVAQTGDSFARIGATGSGLTSLAASATALSNVQWTNARAGYLDNANTGTVIATQADVQAINQGASRRVILTAVLPFIRPPSATNTYTVELRTFDASGNLTAATGTPTITATGIITGSLNSHLSAVTNPSTGVYRSTYTVNSTDTIEQVRLDSSAVVGGSTFPATFYTQISDVAAVDFTSADRTVLNRISTDYTTARAGFLDNIGGAVASVTGAVGSVTATVTVGTNNDKTGYALTSAYDAAKTAAAAGAAMTLTSGERNAVANALLDLADGIETTVTLRQAIRAIVADFLGVNTGAGTGHETYSAMNNAGTQRLDCLIDANGNRTSVTFTG